MYYELEAEEQDTPRASKRRGCFYRRCVRVTTINVYRMSTDEEQSESMLNAFRQRVQRIRITTSPKLEVLGPLLSQRKTPSGTNPAKIPREAAPIGVDHEGFKLGVLGL